MPPSKLTPHALGLGLRSQHYRELGEPWPALDYFEIITENFLSAAPAARWHLDRVKERYPVVLHGVGLNILGPTPPDPAYLDRLCWLADYVDAPFVSDHLCWTGVPPITHHDLLPAPYVPELAGLVAERAAFVQRQLGRPFGLENLSSYVQFERSTQTEWDFYSSVVREAGCWFMLDLNNVYVSSENHGFSPVQYLDAIDFSRVLQVHIAGHLRQSDGLLVDTHDRPVTEPVWQLYEEAYQAHGPFPTLLEWDDHVPPLKGALDELAKARVRRG